MRGASQQGCACHHLFRKVLAKCSCCPSRARGEWRWARETSLCHPPTPHFLPCLPPTPCLGTAFKYIYMCPFVCSSRRCFFGRCHLPNAHFLKWASSSGGVGIGRCRPRLYGITCPFLGGLLSFGKAATAWALVVLSRWASCFVARGCLLLASSAEGHRCPCLAPGALGMQQGSFG